MENGASIYNEDYEEISLMEIIGILLKRKWLIALCLSLTLLLTVGYLLIKKPVYESRAVVKIGEIGIITLEDPNLLVQRLMGEYRVDDDSEGVRKLPFLESVSLDQNKAKNIVQLITRGRSAKQARDYLNKVTAKLLREHQDLYQQAVDLRQAQLSSLKEQIKQLDAEIAQYNQSIRMSSNSALAAILTLERIKLDERRPDLERQITDLELMLSPLNSKPTQLLRQPTLPVNPTVSKLKFLLIAVVLGLMLGVGAAFGAEFIAKYKQVNQGTGLSQN